MEILQNMRVSLMLEIYGNLLTEKQKIIISDFYDNNISLSEIALNYNTTRQAVNDLIKRSVKKLEGFEKKLHLLDKFQKIRKKINLILEELDNNKFNKEKIKDQITSILEDY